MLQHHLGHYLLKNKTALKRAQTYLYLLSSLQQKNILTQISTWYHAHLLPLFSHKICQIIRWEKHKSKLKVLVILNISSYNSSWTQIPSLLLNFSNSLTSKAFVKMSASCASVVTCSRVTTLSSTRSLMKWCRMSICFVLLCFIGFFEMLIALK